MRPAFGAGQPNACKVITDDQYTTAIGPVTLKTSEGVSTCIVGKKLNVSVVETGALFAATFRKELQPVAGLNAGWSKRNGGLYGV